MSNKRLVPLNVVALATVPVGGHRPGDLVYSTADGNIYVSDGTSWSSLGGAGGLGTTVDGGTSSSVYSTTSVLDGGTASAQ